MEDAPRILVVDDEPGPREALREILHPKYRVMTAENGPDALQLLSTSPADLVLLDLKMPGMNGIDVLRAIKETDANVEAIMMTAYASLETIRGAMAYGASGYLVKPFREDEIEPWARVLDPARAVEPDARRIAQVVRLCNGEVDVDRVHGRHGGQQRRLALPDEIAAVDLNPANDSVDRGLDGRIAEVQLGLDQSRSRGLDR